MEHRLFMRILERFSVKLKSDVFRCFHRQCISFPMILSRKYLAGNILFPIVEHYDLCESSLCNVPEVSITGIFSHALF